MTRVYRVEKEGEKTRFVVGTTQPAHDEFVALLRADGYTVKEDPIDESALREVQKVRAD